MCLAAQQGPRENVLLGGSRIQCHRGPETLPAAPAAARSLPGSGCTWRQMAGATGGGREATSGEGGCHFSGLGVLRGAVTSLHFGATDGNVASKEGVWALTLPRFLGHLGIVNIQTPENCLAGVAPPVWDPLGICTQVSLASSQRLSVAPQLT